MVGWVFSASKTAPGTGKGLTSWQVLVLAQQTCLGKVHPLRHLAWISLFYLHYDDTSVRRLNDSSSPENQSGQASRIEKDWPVGEEEESGITSGHGVATVVNEVSGHTAVNCRKVPHQKKRESRFLASSKHVWKSGVFPIRKKGNSSLTGIIQRC